MNNNDDDLDKLLDKYLKIMDIQTNSIESVILVLKKSKFNKTGKCLVDLLLKSSSISGAIINSAVNKNCYSILVLFRPLIEHSFRHLYIYMKTLNEDSDAIADKYLKILKSAEDLESIEKINNYNKAVNTKNIVWNTKGEHNNSIRKIKTEFNISNIFYYMIGVNNNDENSIFKLYKVDVFLNEIIRYAELSSTIHGGPSADFTSINGNGDSKLLEKNCHAYARDALNIYLSIVKTTYLFASLMDQKLNKTYEKISKL